LQSGSHIGRVASMQSVYISIHTAILSRARSGVRHATMMTANPCAVKRCAKMALFFSR